ncbi:hypothetical protein M514_12561 [Trichuris suis]|uniref:Uncharacterized protein n=1 Tax=Trichuris suis TaxID=68888 RepID=A0A085N6D6_9BILA|nr:hypothetical protein M513_12561 [Trichuris suis]KFD65032.1 hypothetical protein M514_12561 [Trichuris suis]
MPGGVLYGPRLIQACYRAIVLVLNLETELEPRDPIKLEGKGESPSHKARMIGRNQTRVKSMYLAPSAAANNRRPDMTPPSTPQKLIIERTRQLNDELPVF